jgi:hypothetical protein
MKKIIFLSLVSFNLWIAESNAAEAVKVQPPANKSLSAENGRFVFGQISEFRRDQYMLDTKTGRLWRTAVTSIGEGENKQEITLLEPILYVGPEGKWLPEPK